MREWVQRRTIEVWQKRITVACWAHQQLTSRYRSNARTLNVVTVALNAMVGSAIFSSLADSEASFYLRSLAGCFSMVVAVIAAVKSELNFDGLHEQHRMAHRGYDRLKQKLETFRQVRFISPVSDDGELNEEWAMFLEEVNTQNNDAPTIPEDVREKLEKRYEAGLAWERNAMEGELEARAGERRAREPVSLPRGFPTAPPLSSSLGRGRGMISFSKHVTPGPITGGATPKEDGGSRGGGGGVHATSHRRSGGFAMGSAWGRCGHARSAEEEGEGHGASGGDGQAAISMSPHAAPVRVADGSCEMPALLAHASGSFSSTVSIGADSPSLSPGGHGRCNGQSSSSGSGVTAYTC